MNEKTYNGWTNYETWLVKLWMDNDEGSNSYWNEQAEECIKNVIEEGKPDYLSHKKEAARNLAGMIKDQHEENSPTENSGVYADLMNAALSEVNWDEIASHYFDEIDVYVAMWNLPGCLPEMEPVYFLDEDEARQFLADEIENSYDTNDESPTIEEVCEKKQEAIMRGEMVYDESGYVYTVTKA